MVRFECYFCLNSGFRLLLLGCARFYFFSSRRRHTRWPRVWSSDVCSSDLLSSRQVIQNLFPGYFALVMATGIIGIAAHQLEYLIISTGLILFNFLAYVILWILFILRIYRYSDVFWKDLTDHNRGPGFFTLIAATNVIGSQFIIKYKVYSAAWDLWVFFFILWFVITYMF